MLNVKRKYFVLVILCSYLLFLRIFYPALSQDENEMGRFLKDQGALDKTKAGKMMIAVGKAQSFAAQQRFAIRIFLTTLIRTSNQKYF